MKPRRRYAVRTPPPTPPGTEVAGQREMLAVREVVHAFLNADRPDEAFQFALDRISPVVGAALSSVYLLDGASELMRLVAAHNWPDHLRPWLADVRVRVGFGPSGEAASERRVIEVPDVFADADLEDWQEVARELGFRALVSLPLQNSQAVVGAVTFYFRSWDDFTIERRGLLRLVADLMAAATEKSRLVDRIRRAESAAVEALTELDRQYVAVAHARRDARSLTVAATAALQPHISGLPGKATAAVQRVLDDLALAAGLEDESVAVAADQFDPRLPLRDALRQVSESGTAVHLIGEEPIHELPLVRGDAEKVTVALARLLERAAAVDAVTELRASVAVSDGRVEYRVPGVEGNDLAWKLAAVIVERLDGRLTVESSATGETAVLSLPLGM